MQSGAVLVLGAQWGDEGKGKFVDMLAADADYVCRCAGGNNAGHTVVVDGVSYDFHLLPSGLIHKNSVCVIGNGVVAHLPGLLEELKKNEAKGLTDWVHRLRISDRTHLVFDLHQEIDKLEEVEKGGSSIGTTKKGIGPAYAAKAARISFRVCDLYGDWQAFEARLRRMVANYQRRYPALQVDVEREVALYKELAQFIAPLVCDTVVLLQQALSQGKRVLVEGANATMLDIDFGTYPYVTSSSCTAGGASTGLGIPPRAIRAVYGVVKAYTTRVGGGAFATEQLNEIGEKLQTIGHEVGVTTGRKRRCGWLDVVQLRYSQAINGFDKLCLTKLDVLDTFPEIKIAVAYHYEGKELASFPADMNVLETVEVVYETLPGWQTSIEAVRKFEDLPPNAQQYVQRVETLLGVPVAWIGVGPARDAIISR